MGTEEGKNREFLVFTRLSCDSSNGKGVILQDSTVGRLFLSRNKKDHHEGNLFDFRISVHNVIYFAYQSQGALTYTIKCVRLNCRKGSVNTPLSLSAQHHAGMGRKHSVMPSSNLIGRTFVCKYELCT